jgi:NIMA (never in mitosis gene a)-related kinase
MDRFVKLKKVGSGSYGEVVLVREKRTREKLVIKVIDASSMTDAEREDTLRETKVLASLDHPNIIRYRESFFSRDGRLCIAMDYADGGDLHGKIQDCGGHHMPEAEIWRIFVQVCLALKHVHDRRIIHRDLKTQNLLITAAGVVKLADFGIAKVLKNTGEQARTVIGTPYYLSPELCAEKPVCATRVGLFVFFGYLP